MQTGKALAELADRLCAIDIQIESTF